MAIDTDYVLGTGDEEMVRLGLQHRVWRAAALDAWTRAGIRAGSAVVDIGAGPGYAALDLADLVGSGGRVVAIERSARFVEFLREQVRARRLSQVKVCEHDLVETPIAALGCDAAWCRWVACFVASPAALVNGVRAALKPGGVAIFHEYVDYASWRAVPPRPALDAFVVEVMASWRATGGEPDIARALPALLRTSGFRVLSARPIVFAAHPGDEIWPWPAGFVRSGAPRLSGLGRVSETWVRRVIDELNDIEADEASLMITPMVLELIAEKL